MLTKTIAITAAVAVLALGAHAAGLVNLRTATEGLGLLVTTERYIIVGIDITEGRENEVPKDFKAIQGLLTKTNPGDKIEVFLIHSRSESAQEALFVAEMPGDEGPMGVSLERAQKAAQRCLEDRWKKKIGTFLADKQFVQQTDLFDFFRFVSQKKEFHRSKRPILMLFTDGQQVGDGFNFERKVPDRQDLTKVKGNDLMADLKGISVTLLGCTATHNISNYHWRKLQAWWGAYLKEAGAETISITSERGVGAELL